jgi:protein tyrosine phosphatase
VVNFDRPTVVSLNRPEVVNFIGFSNKALFGEIKAENIMVHCGSGVTACHTLLALDYAEMEIPKLYVGSWSEWSRNKKR